MMKPCVRISIHVEDDIAVQRHTVITVPIPGRDARRLMEAMARTAPDPPKYMAVQANKMVDVCMWFARIESKQ